MGIDQSLDSDYDRFGNRDALTYTDGSQVLNHSWTFDDLDRLESANLAAGANIQFSYHPTDDLKTITRPNQVVSTYEYWEHGPVKSITVRDSGNVLLHDLLYTGIDPTLNVTTLAESRVDGGPSHDFVYGYDGVDRLTSADNPSAFGFLNTQERYEYDDAGNRETDGVPADYDYDQANRIAASPSATWTFDDDGNVSTRIGALEESFTYDRTNRLRAWEKGPVGGAPTTTASYVYDPFGRRIKKTVDGTTTWFLWDGGNLLVEFDGAGARTRRYTYAGGFAPIEVADPTGPTSEVVFDVHTDHLDTPRMMTNAAQGSAWRQSHESFGQAVVQSAGEDLQVRFPGQYLDEETGLHYNRFRYYDPAIGRYINADPIGQGGGFNEYLYTGDRPTALIDPFGQNPGLLALFNPGSLAALTAAGEACLAGAAFVGATALGVFGLETLMSKDKTAEDDDEDARLDALKETLENPRPTQKKLDEAKEKKKDFLEKSPEEVLEDGDTIRRTDPDPAQNADKKKQQGKTRMPIGPRGRR